MASFAGASRAQAKPIFRVKELFFDRKKVDRSLSKAEKKNLTIIGSFIRTSARRSIVRARRKNRSELTKAERKSLRRRFKEPDIRKIPKSKFPFASADPGRPPRVPGLVSGSILRSFLFFAYEARRRSVVIGPALVGGVSGTAPRALESGGRSSGKNLRAHPYMGPALIENLPVIRNVWRNSLKR